jgi:ribosomal protein S15P/S13E
MEQERDAIQVIEERNQRLQSYLRSEKHAPYSPYSKDAEVEKMEPAIVPILRAKA